jgi:hypothetical protein
MLVSGWVVMLLQIALPLLFYFCVASFSVTLLLFLSPCFFASSSKRWFKEEGRRWCCC